MSLLSLLRSPLTMQEYIPALPQHRRMFLQRLKQVGATAVHHAKNHAGVGIVCAVAYFDP